MKKDKQKRLEAKGWTIGSTEEFLSLNEEESAYIEMKLALSRSLQERRRKSKLTQYQLARMVRSSESRIIKMEAGDPSVSLDLLIRTLLALGASRHHLAKMITTSGRSVTV